MVGLTLGSALYTFIVDRFIDADWVIWGSQDHRPPSGSSVVQIGRLVILAGGLGVAAWSARHGTRSGDRSIAHLANGGSVLVGLGVAWVLLGAIDHAIGSFEVAPGGHYSLIADVVFHGAGFVVAWIGLLLLAVDEVADSGAES